MAGPVRGRPFCLYFAYTSKKETLMKKLLALSLALFCVPSVFSQDIIHLRSGRDVEAKIIEMDGDKIRYKKFSYQEGMDLVVPVDKVASITYANGEIETFDEPEAPAAPAQAQAPATTTVIYVAEDKRDPREDPESVWYKAPDQSYSVWVEPLGFALWGPMVGVGYRNKTSMLADAYIRLPQFGYAYGEVSDSPDELTGIALGVELKTLVPRRNGGWYAGGMVDIGDTVATYHQGELYEKEEQWFTLVFGFSGGYRFCFGQGFHLDLGVVSGALFVSAQDWRYSNSANSYYSSTYTDSYEGYIAYFGMLLLAAGIDF